MKKAANRLLFSCLKLNKTIGLRRPRREWNKTRHRGQWTCVGFEPSASAKQELRKEEHKARGNMPVAYFSEEGP
ncbi:MAG: hypothetical protein IKI42_01560, partial [Clostridia bacterium]|nr:hypothetical protein [Clostridia bacterium]